MQGRQMNTKDYLKILVEDIHSTVVATIDRDNHPVTRCIDMMLYDERGVYFITAKGKEFYSQLMEQKYISLSAVQGKKCISLKGKVKNIHKEKMDLIFEKNPYMKSIYPEGKRDVIEVFCLYECEGNFFDITDPLHIQRGSFQVGNGEVTKSGYYVTKKCSGCQKCLSACPQNCIEMQDKKALIDPNRCLHCGRCMDICPFQAIQRY